MRRKIGRNWGMLDGKWWYGGRLYGREVIGWFGDFIPAVNSNYHTTVQPFFNPSSADSAIHLHRRGGFQRLFP